MEEITVTEGQEYRITANGRTVYEGIAESDTEAEERLGEVTLWISATTSQRPLTFTIELV